MLALDEGIEESYITRSIVCEILNISIKSEHIPIECVIDNKSLKDSIYSTKTLTKKHLKVDICAIREMIEIEIKLVMWKESKMQLADCLTKTGVSGEKLIDAL